MLDVPLDGLNAPRKPPPAPSTTCSWVRSPEGSGARERHGTSCEELRLTLPISTRHETDAAAGNRITLMRFMIPVGIVDPVERMHAIHESTGEARAESRSP